METWESEEGTTEEAGESEPEEETHPPASSCARRPKPGSEKMAETPLGDHPTGEAGGDEWWNPGAHRLISEVAPGEPRGRQLPHSEAIKRRKLRKREEETRDQEWERARQSAWLREMLSDMSSSEDEENGRRFAESRRWMSELFEIP